MSPLFSSKDHAPGESAAMAAEIERVSALPLPQLAEEVMRQGFGPDGPGAPGRPGTLEAPGQLAERVSATEIARRFTPAFSGQGVGSELQSQLVNLVAEGLQILQNAALVRVSWRGGADHYLATRLGRLAAERGAVARVVSGGGL